MKLLTSDVKLTYDGDLLDSVVFRRGNEVRPLWSKLERLTPDQMIFWVDRLDSLCSIPSEWALAQAIEQSSGVIVQKRALFVRTLFCEINRLLWLTTFLSKMIGTLGHESLEEQILVLREGVFAIQEELTGGRLLPQIFCVGGCRRELALGDTQKIKQFIQGWRFSWGKWLELILPDEFLQKRLSGLMVIRKETVQKYAWWGVVGKASGVPYDSRKHRPHGAYPFLDFDIPSRDSCDALGRFQVSCEEINLSLSLLDQLLLGIPLDLEPKSEIKKLNSGIYFGAAESAKGTVVAALEANSDNQILSVKLFTAGQRVWPVIEPFFKGIRAEDFELGLASLGLDPEEAEA